jgi:hypothetical protein
MALFPEDRCEAIAGDASIVQLRLSEMQLRRPRQWGACWLAGQLWQELQLDRFWADHLPPSRKRTRWDQILQVLATYRLIAPGSEWRELQLVIDRLSSQSSSKYFPKRRTRNGLPQDVEVAPVPKRLGVLLMYLL